MIAPKYIRSSTLKYGGEGIKDVKKYKTPVTEATEIRVPIIANVKIAPLQKMKKCSVYEIK